MACVRGIGEPLVHHGRVYSSLLGRPPAPRFQRLDRDSQGPTPGAHVQYCFQRRRWSSIGEAHGGNVIGKGACRITLLLPNRPPFGILHRGDQVDI